MIYVDGSTLGYPKTGIYRYSVSLINDVIARNKGERIVIFVSSLVSEFNAHDITQVRLLPMWFPLKNFLIPFVLIPIYILLRGDKNDSILYTSAIGPLFKLSGSLTFVVYDFVPFKYLRTMPWISGVYRWIGLVFGLHNSDKFICISRAVQSELHHYSKKGHASIILYPEFRDNLAQRGSTTIKKFDKNFLLVLGTDEPRKGNELLYKATVDCLENGSWPDDLFIVSIGAKGWGREGEYKRKLLEQGLLLDLGFVSDDEKNQYLDGCIAYVNLSEYEGFGIPLAEALMHEKPCIVSDIPIFRELTSEQKVYFVDRECCSLEALLRDYPDWTATSQKLLLDNLEDKVIGVRDVQF